MAAPLVARGQRLGVFNVWRRHGRPPFEPEDEQLLADLGRRAGTAVDNLRLLAARTHVAARLQDTLLPARLPSVDGMELAAGYLVAEDAADVGGDLYDAFAVGDGSYALIIGDVAGRGVDAAGLTGLTRATLRALAGQLPVPAALARLNTLLAERTGSERFLTLAYLLVRLVPDGADLQVWLAGHLPPSLVRADGAVEALGVPGTLLGILPEVCHTGREYHLTHGDLLLLYTDGLAEARGQRGLFGTAMLPALLPSLAGRTAAEAVTCLERAVIDYRSGSADDTAMLAMRLTPPAEPSEQAVFDVRLAAEQPAIAAIRRAVAERLAAHLAAQRTNDVLVAVDTLLDSALRHVRATPPRSPRLDPIRLRVMRRGDLLRVEVSYPWPRSAPPAPGEGIGGQASGPDPVRAVATDRGVSTFIGTACAWFETNCTSA
jgi:hypothetical protein